MTNREFKRAIVALGWTHACAMLELDLSYRTITRYVSGELPVPRPVEFMIKSLLARVTKKAS